MMHRKMSSAGHIVAALVTAMIAGLVGCSAASDGADTASATAEAISVDQDRCGANSLASFGTGFETCGGGVTPAGTRALQLCSAQAQLEAQLSADGCRLCVDYNGTRMATRVDPIDPRSEYDWWCAVCPQTSAVFGALSNPNFTSFPVRVRVARTCLGYDTVQPGEVGPFREFLVEWDPRCPAGGCKSSSGS
jgi:hypothetical protein